MTTNRELQIKDGNDKIIGIISQNSDGFIAHAQGTSKTFYSEASAIIWVVEEDQKLKMLKMLKEVTPTIHAEVVNA